MSDALFVEVKKIPIEDYLAGAGKSPAIINLAANSRRVNPCPICGHNDCFTIYLSDNSFNCFSCDAAGDVIILEKKINGHPSNLEAAKALAARYNIDTNDPHYKPSPVSLNNSKKKKLKTGKEKNLPVIDTDKALALRKFCADWFHGNLLSDKSALEYQTDHRGHSLDILKQFKVGLMGPGFISAATGAGYTISDLAAIGLMVPYRKKFRQFIPNGWYIYPQTSSGNVLHFTVKNPEPKSKKKKEWQLYRIAGDPDWLFHNQDAVHNDTVWLVEGANDLLTLIEYGNISNCAAINGNTNTPYILAWYEKNAKAKTFYLCFDPDDAGEKYIKKHTAAITAAGGKALTVDLSTHNMQIDDLLRKAENPKELARLLTKNAAAHTRDQPGGVTSDRYEFKSFEVLGDMEDEKLAIWSPSNRKTYFIAIKDLTLDKLIQIGGPEIFARVARKETDDDKILFSTLKKVMIMKSRSVQFGKLPKLGQGIHQLDETRLLIINGAYAFIWDGEKFTPQDHPLINNKLIFWESGKEWINFNELKNAVLTMDKTKANEAFREIADVFFQWGFVNTAMDVIMLTGFLCAQVVQAAWKWRPHLWVAGPQGSGKSRLTDAIEAIGGRLVWKRQGNVLTEPGLRQGISCYSLMTIIDEFEKSKHRDAIIEILRSSGGGGIFTKGSSSQIPIDYYIRHMVMLCSIETGLVRAAEKYRYLSIQTYKDQNRKPEVPSTEKGERLRIKLVSYALWAVNKAKGLIKKMSAPAYDNRWVESISVPMSMMAVSTDDPEKELSIAVNEYLRVWSISQAGNVLEDEEALMESIMQAKIRISEEQPGRSEYQTQRMYVERTVSQMLDERNDLDELPEDYDKTLQANGIRFFPHDKSLFLQPKAIAHNLLRNTDWRTLNIRDLLLRLPKARASIERVGGRPSRGVLVPKKAWQNEGQANE